MPVANDEVGTGNYRGLACFTSGQGYGGSDRGRAGLRAALLLSAK